jgi:hypothetical protein
MIWLRDGGAVLEWKCVAANGETTCLGTLLNPGAEILRTGQERLSFAGSARR